MDSWWVRAAAHGHEQEVCAWSTPKRGMSVGAEYSLCVNEQGGTCSSSSSVPPPLLLLCTRLKEDSVVREMAVESCRRDPPEGLDSIQSAAFQKDRARAQAYLNWELEWHGEQAKHQLHLNATCVSSEGAAYTHAIR
ncbi:hypothetical protein EI94DRAFT_1698743 [Lactarius quietus]|nr:hypothetical protein EI94DRAFT_1698743 [Lactarius quietus]